MVFVAGLVNGIAGFGIALVAMGALSMLIDLRLAIILMSMVLPMTNVVQLYNYRAHGRGIIRRVALLTTAAVAGAVVGSQLFVALPLPALSVLLGAITLWYVVAMIRDQIALLGDRMGRFFAPFVGLFSGMIGGTIGASGPVLGGFMMALGMRGRTLVFGLCIVFVAISATRVLMLAVLDQYTSETLMLSTLLFVPAYVGQAIGFHFGRSLSTATFERVLLAVLALASASLLIRGFGGILS